MIQLVDPCIIELGGLKVWITQCDILLKHGLETQINSQGNYFFLLQRTLAEKKETEITWKPETSPDQRTLVMRNVMAVMERYQPPDRDVICAVLLSIVVKDTTFYPSLN